MTTTVEKTAGAAQEKGENYIISRSSDVIR